MDHLKMQLLLEMVVFHCYVSLPEGILAYQQEFSWIANDPERCCPGALLHIWHGLGTGFLETVGWNVGMLECWNVGMGCWLGVRKYIAE